MPKHIVRLITLLVVAVILAVVARFYLVPHSYYRYGNYRGNAVAEIARDPPLYKGSRSCASCHRRIFNQWSASAHRVQCEDCHGPSGEHPRMDAPPLPINPDTHQLLMQERYRIATGRMQMPTSTAHLCLQCHASIAGRPATQPQVIASVHAGTQQCAACHDVHSPKIVFPAVPQVASMGSAATGRAASAACAACHGATGISVSPMWPNLAGQQRAYVVRALESYRTGKRKAAPMNMMAAALSDTQIANLAAYFSSLTAGRAAVQVQARRNVPAGVRLVSAKACATCHGPNGSSSNPVVPNLAGQKQAYLVSALDAYRSGSRREALMSRVARGLTDGDVRRLSLYYSKLQCADAACKEAP